MHIRFPGQQGGHFAVPGCRLADLVGQYLLAEQGVVVRHLRGVVESQRKSFLKRHQEDVGDLGVVGFHAGGANQHHAAEGRRIHGGHLRGQPATHGKADHRQRAETLLFHEPAVEIGQVVHPLHPVGPVRGAETGVRRGDHPEMRRQCLAIRHPARIAASAVQHQQRLAATAAEDLGVKARNDYRFFPPIARHAGSPIARCVRATRSIRTPTLRIRRKADAQVGNSFHTHAYASLPACCGHAARPVRRRRAAFPAGPAGCPANRSAGSG